MAVGLSGGSASTLTMSNEFNIFGENTIFKGTRLWNYAAINDKLIEKEIEKEEKSFWDKLCDGVSKACEKVKDFANSVQGKVLAGITFVGVVAIGVAYGASVYVSGGGTLAFAPQVLGLMTYVGGSAYVLAKGYSDTKNNTNSSFSDYMFEGLIGATRGLISLAAFGAVAEFGMGIGLTNLEIVLAGGYTSGAVGSYFEQFTRTGNVDFEQVMEESFTEGLLGVMGYTAGKAISLGIKQANNAISKIISQNSNKAAGVADDVVNAVDDVVNAVDDVADDISNKVDDVVDKVDDSVKVNEKVEGGTNSNVISVTETTPPGSSHPVKVYTDGNAQINKGKIDTYIRGKIKEPSNYAELKQRIKDLKKIQNNNPSEFTKSMEKELIQCEKTVHNYERSKSMGELLKDAGIADTSKNNEMIAESILNAAKEVKPGNTKIVSYIKGTNKTVLIESWWIIDSDGTPYCSTIIVKTLK